VSLGAASMRLRRNEVIAVHIDEQALRSSLQRLRQATFDTDVAVVMKRAVNSVHRVFGCNGAGTMIAGGRPLGEQAPAA
jgi:hypothetical protein